MRKSFLLAQERERAVSSEPCWDYSKIYQDFFVYTVVTDEPLGNYWGGLGGALINLFFPPLQSPLEGEGRGTKVFCINFFFSFDGWTDSNEACCMTSVLLY